MVEEDKKEPQTEDQEKEKVEIEDIVGEDELDLEDAVSEEKDKTASIIEETEEKVEEAVDEMADTGQKDVLEKAVDEVKEEEKEEKPKKKTKKKSDKKWLKIAGIVLLTIAITAAAVLGVMYYLQQQESAEEEVKEEIVEEVVEEVEEAAEEGYVYISSEVGLNMREEPDTGAKVLAIIPYATKIEVISEKAGWIETEYQNEKGWVSADYTTKDNPSVYENDTYGFGFTFKPSWAGYKFFKTDSSEGTSIIGYYVAIPTSDTTWKEGGSVESGYASLFAMAIYTPAEWALIENTDGPKPAKLGESDKYVYTYLPGQAHPKDLGTQYNEINEIIKTFEVLN